MSSNRAITVRLWPTIRWASRLALYTGLSGLLLVLAGCVGGTLSGMGVLIAGALLGISLLSSGCAISQRVTGEQSDASEQSDAGEQPYAGENCRQISVCRDGVLNQVEACCPVGSICNYAGTNVCDDGSCVQLGELCPEDCDGNAEQFCDDGVVASACCPEGMVCNYGENMEICDDGSCVDYPDTCAPTSVECQEVGFEIANCIDGVPGTEWVCPCPPPGEGTCNYFPQEVSVCDDGSCVVEPEVCPEAPPCDGTLEQFCDDEGELAVACCPSGWVCNYGLGLEICNDGSCVDSFITSCPE